MLTVPVKGTPVRTNVSVGTEAIRLSAVGGNRKSILFQNQGSGTVHLGGPDVAVNGDTRGYALFAGASFVDNSTTGEWWGVSEGGTNIVHVIAVA